MIAANAFQEKNQLEINYIHVTQGTLVSLRWFHVTWRDT